MKWSPLIIGMTAALVAFLVPIRPAFAFDCTGTAVANNGGTLSLICSGTCTTGSCAVQTGTDAQGEFQYCGCNSGDTDSCCTVVLRKIAGVWTPKKYGSCPACPAAGSCKLCGAITSPYVVSAPPTDPRESKFRSWTWASAAQASVDRRRRLSPAGARNESGGMA